MPRRLRPSLVLAVLPRAHRAATLPAGRSASARTPTIVRGDGDNEIQGTPEGPDVIVAGDGDDFVEAHSGEDRVCGGGGNDLMFTGPARTTRSLPAAGSDEVHGVGGKDRLEGREGRRLGIGRACA